jgi:hypothetical protein
MFMNIRLQLYHSILLVAHLKAISVTHLGNPFYITDKIIPCRRARINNVLIAAEASIG